MKTPTKTLPVLLALLLVNSISSANAENLPGQKVEDNTGNMFMEEVIDGDKWKQEELQRKKKSNLERSRPTDAQLQNVGVQVTPSGSIIPLINRGAPPVREMGTTFTSSFQPLYPGYVVVPGNPYPGAPFGRPNIGIGPLGGIPYGGNLGGIAPYGVAPYGTAPGVILNSPGYSYTWQSTPGAPSTPPSSVTTQGTIRNSGFVGGYAGQGLNGGFQTGGVLGLPSTTQFNSTTTFTPIPPSAPSSPQ
ncbi:MAG: hypothetical protein SGJ27_12775 [Candidatus Melainabacteria bacterium]|nr:hypothetical protein [Candidatus Melainabacteria bacterium]